MTLAHVCHRLSCTRNGKKIDKNGRVGIKRKQETASSNGGCVRAALACHSQQWRFPFPKSL